MNAYLGTILLHPLLQVYQGDLNILVVREKTYRQEYNKQGVCDLVDLLLVGSPTVIGEVQIPPDKHKAAVSVLLRALESMQVDVTPLRKKVDEQAYREWEASRGVFPDRAEPIDTEDW